MPAVTGRTTDGRAVTGVVTTLSSTAITGPANSFEEEDAGRKITGTGIPANATLSSVTSPTAAVLSVAATAAGTVTATLAAQTGEALGFRGWGPESDAESETYSVAATNAGQVTPDRITSPTQGVVQRSRT